MEPNWDEDERELLEMIFGDDFTTGLFFDDDTAVEEAILSNLPSTETMLEDVS